MAVRQVVLSHAGRGTRWVRVAGRRLRRRGGREPSGDGVVEHDAERDDVPPGRPRRERDRLSVKSGSAPTRDDSGSRLRDGRCVQQLDDERPHVPTMEVHPDDRPDADPSEHPLRDLVVERTIQRPDGRVDRDAADSAARRVLQRREDRPLSHRDELPAHFLELPALVLQRARPTCVKPHVRATPMLAALSGLQLITYRSAEPRVHERPDGLADEPVPEVAGVRPVAERDRAVLVRDRADVSDERAVAPREQPVREPLAGVELRRGDVEPLRAGRRSARARRSASTAGSRRGTRRRHAAARRDRTARSA